MYMYVLFRLVERKLHVHVAPFPYTDWYIVQPFM